MTSSTRRRVVAVVVVLLSIVWAGSVDRDTHGIGLWSLALGYVLLATSAAMGLWRGRRTAFAQYVVWSLATMAGALYFELEVEPVAWKVLVMVAVTAIALGAGAVAVRAR